MKKLLLLVPFIALFMVSCGPTSNDVINVNDRLVQIIKQSSEGEAAFFKVCLTYDSSQIKTELDKFLATCKKAKSDVEALEVHKDINDLKTDALHLTSEYVRTEPEYKEYARLYSIPNDRYTAEDEKATKTVAEKINNQINSAFSRFDLVQERFAKEYNFIISKSINKK